MPAGRPTLYDPKYCDEVVEHMKEGLSFESFAGKIGVSKQTIYDWKDKNPEFLDAVGRGLEACRLFWEKKGIEHLIYDPKGEQINSQIWSLNIRNRFPKEWSDKQQVEHSGQVGLENLITESNKKDAGSGKKD